MSETIRVPDLGGEGQVIEILVKVGDQVQADQGLVTLESEKASMDVPAPKAGKITKLHFKIGDTLKEGDPLVDLESADEKTEPEPAESQKTAAPGAEAAAAAKEADRGPAEREPSQPAKKEESQAPEAKESGEPAVETLQVPDIGGEGQVIEVLVKEGDQVQADQGVVTLESEKASMDVPVPKAGKVVKLHFKEGDTLKPGDPLLDLQSAAGESAAREASPAKSEEQGEQSAPQPSAPAEEASSGEDAATPAIAKAEPAGAPSRDGAKVHAGPAVRLLARGFGVDLARVQPSGPKGRILKEDVQAYVKSELQQPRSSGAGLPAVPEVDYAKFGEVEEVKLSRLRQLGAVNLHRSWVNVPHVTQFESADITELEAFRKAQKLAAEKAGVKLTLLPILLKACAHLLKELPDFNSALKADGQALIHRKYVHLGFAVDTPDGLLVPVIRDADQKSLLQLAGEAADLADKARNKKLTPNQMQGACFTISSLGHIGGTAFTPIVNAPEVAILGVSKASIQPLWDGQAFQPRLLLPLSLSYDHRVINGAAAARFTKRLSELLTDIRTLLL